MFPNVRISIMLNRVKSYGTLTSLLSFQGVSPPIFQGAFSSFTFLSRGMKQIPRFFLNGEEHSFLPSDRQYTLQRSYFVSPLFAYSLFVESNSLITLSVVVPIFVDTIHSYLRAIERFVALLELFQPLHLTFYTKYLNAALSLFHTVTHQCVLIIFFTLIPQNSHSAFFNYIDTNIKIISHFLAHIITFHYLCLTI